MTLLPARRGRVLAKEGVSPHPRGSGRSGRRSSERNSTKPKRLGLPPSSYGKCPLRVIGAGGGRACDAAVIIDKRRDHNRLAEERRRRRRCAAPKKTGAPRSGELASPTAPRFFLGGGAAASWRGRLIRVPGMCQLRSARRSSGPARERGASAPAAVQSDGAASRHRCDHARPREWSARAT